jgi:transcriptional regulator ATRX
MVVYLLFFQVFELASVKVNETRAKLLENWHEDGGIMIIGYEMFRNLSQGSTFIT